MTLGRKLALGTVTVFVSVVLIGCTNATRSPKAEIKPAEKRTDAGRDEPHEHEPGAHGGIVVEIGRDNYHAEAVFEKGGILRLYVLGRDERQVQDIEAQPLSAYVKIVGDNESESIVLRPQPQPGDRDGMTSLFVGHLPKEFAGQRVEVVIPSVRIEGNRFRIAFKSAPDASHGDTAMPAKVADEAERKLYLTPGGAYTEADIKANGNMTASEKFKGIKAEHDLKPKPGDKICPITLTKANPKFSWIIGGKSYEFCCPPCVDEFVSLAKENPSELKEPDNYRRK